MANEFLYFLAGAIVGVIIYYMYATCTEKGFLMVLNGYFKDMEHRKKEYKRSMKKLNKRINSSLSKIREMLK